MDANFTEMLEEFMGSALVTWVHLFESVVGGEGNGPHPHQYMEVNFNSQNALKPYLRLTNGIFLNEVMRIIDPNPKVEHIYHNVNDDKILRVQNFSILNRHLRAYYQENLEQLILMPLPNIAILGRDPLTEGAMEELRRLLLLLLGCAVQCERKEEFIEQIQSLDIETQAALATCIQEVTQDPSAVLPLQYGELCGLEGAELQGLLCSMARQIQGLLSQRDTHLERIAEQCQEHVSSQSHSAPPGGFGDGPPEGVAVQLADSRAKLRRLKQELEDKGDQLLDYKQEMQTMEEELKKLQRENRTLQGEARVSWALRDELDCLRERAAKAEQLQTELKACTHRLRSLELYRTQLKEQQQHCASLQENKALLEEQLADARARCSVLRELERDNLLLRQKLMDLEEERDMERQRVDELLEMNMSLEAELKHNHSVSHNFQQLMETESDEELSREIDLKPLSVEVDEASSLRLLGAENENAELRRRLEHLQAEQEANSPEVKEELQRQTDRLTRLEEEHQNTLKELQNTKNENASLQKSLEGLNKKHQLQHDGDEKSAKKEKGKQTTVIQRGEGEGKDTRREEKLGTRDGKEVEITEAEITRAQREDAEGEEVLRSEEKPEVKDDGGREMKPRERGEAEGEKEKEVERERERTDVPNEKAATDEGSTEDESLTEMEKGEEEERVKGIEEEALPGSDALLLASQLQQALEEADRQAALAQELRSKLWEQSRRAREAEQRLVLLEAESQRLRKAAESLSEARKQIEALQCESMQTEEELTCLRSQAELQKMESAVIAQLEGERAALERERETLRSAVDTLRAAVRKGDQLDLTNQTLKAELERLGRSLESARRREEELEAELRESGLEVESLSRGRDQAMLEVTRLEQDKEACQSQLDSQRREQRQREREAARLRQQLESTTSALEHSNQRACSLETEHRLTCQELSQLKEVCSQLQDLERDNQHLSAQNTESKAQISSVTQDLANERVHSQELSDRVAELSQKLETSEAKLKMAASQPPHQSEHQRGGSETDTAAPIGLVTGVAGGASPSEPPELKSGLSQEGPEGRRPEGTALQPDAPEASTGTPQHTDAEQRDTKLNKNNDLQTTPETSEGKREPLSERLIDVERENAVLQREREVVLSQLSQSQASCTLLREQLDSLQHHAISLQENCAKLQALNTKLQVEQVSLSSQHASVWTRCSESEARCAALQAESKVWAKEREESAGRMEGLRRDHERLTALELRQEAELEELQAKHRELKNSNRSLESQHRELETRYQELVERRTQLEEREEAMRAEREKTERAEQEQAEREKELARLKQDSDRFQAQQREWVQVQSELLAQGSVLRGEVSAAQLERTRLEGEISALKEQNQQLDLKNVRLTGQHQLLTQLKGNMEEENRHLVDQNQSLTRDNRTLMERSLESRDQTHSQQREYQDKLNELRREKQKLVEKIMDQYRVLDPSMMPTPTKAKKSNWIAERMMKLIKPRGGREGRANFIAAGSMENLADTGDDAPSSPTTSTPSPNPRSAPASPAPLRRVSSQPESEEAPKATTRSARRKLGSRHGVWGMGRGRGGGVSQSFSPGDNRASPRQRLRSAQTGSAAIWEAESSPTPSQESLNEEEKAKSEENLSPHGQSSGAEDCHAMPVQTSHLTRTAKVTKAELSPHDH